MIALFAGLFGAVPGIAAARAEAARPSPAASRALIRGLSSGIGLLLVPVAIILLNGLRRPACEPLAGLLLYGLIAVPSGILAATMGALCGFARPRRAGLLAFSGFLLTLGVAVWPVVHGPQVYVYDHLAGMFPGPIYDEVIRPTPALYLFRLATLLYAGMCGGLALFFGPGRRRRVGVAVAAACGAGAIAISSRAETLHFRASTDLLDRELGGVLDAGHVVLHFPREKTAAERARLARDAEVSWRAVREFAGLPLDGAKVDVFLYRSPEEKRRLIGAAETSFTKPWLRQVHTNDAPAPHPILRHELAHAAFADLSPGIFGVPGRFRGLVPDMALVEGAAVAADWPPGELTVDEEARALYELKLLPDLRRLFRPGLFYAESGPRAYTVAGSFVRFLFRKGGPAAFRSAYSTGEVDVDALASAYLGWLSSEPAPPRAVALAQQRFASPAIARRTCAHEVAELRREGNGPRGRRPLRAATLYSRCVSLEPGNPALLVDLHRARLRAGRPPPPAPPTARAVAPEAVGAAPRDAPHRIGRCGVGRVRSRDRTRAVHDGSRPRPARARRARAAGPALGARRLAPGKRPAQAPRRRGRGAGNGPRSQGAGGCGVRGRAPALPAREAAPEPGRLGRLPALRDGSALPPAAASPLRRGGAADGGDRGVASRRRGARPVGVRGAGKGRESGAGAGSEALARAVLMPIQTISISCGLPVKISSVPAARTARMVTSKKRRSPARGWFRSTITVSSRTSRTVIG